MIAPQNHMNRLRAVIGADSLCLDCDPDALPDQEKSSLLDFVFSFAFNPEYAERVRRGYCLKNADWQARLSDGVLIIAKSDRHIFS